jgi:predicted PurR-regulated permease PerM
MINANRNRPIRILLLALFVLILPAWNALRLGETIFFWKTLAHYNGNPLYIAISASFWIIAGLVIAWGLWLGEAWGWAATLAGIIGYTTWYWFDRLVVQEPPANWSFVLIVNIIFLLILLAILLSSKTRRFFKREPNGRKSKNPTIT